MESIVSFVLTFNTTQFTETDKWNTHPSKYYFVFMNILSKYFSFSGHLFFINTGHKNCQKAVVISLYTGCNMSGFLSTLGRKVHINVCQNFLRISRNWVSR